MRLAQVRRILKKQGNKKKARLLQGFFKTGPGEYAEGDIFFGITVPELRCLAKQCQGLSLEDVLKLLKSAIHEERFLALLLLMFQYQEADPIGKKRIYQAYLAHTHYINNWDLVDVTAKHIVGDYLYDKDRMPLYRLAHSSHLWERRIAVLSTFHFIGKGEFQDSLKISRILLSDPHELIHKAVGWMLREVGKRHKALLERFLRRHAAKMPRVMLRYAIEKFPARQRKDYLRMTTCVK